MTTADTGYRMLSDDFLRDHRALMAKYPVDKAWAKDDSGAHDHAIDPRIRRAKRQMASDARMAVAIARDQEVEGIHGGCPDRETVRLILKAVRQVLGEVDAHRVNRLLHEKWPELGMRDDDNDDEEMEAVHDESDEDNPPSNPNPNQNYNGRGRTAFDMPPGFPGRPTPGGRLVGDAALRAHARVPGSHIGLDPYPALMNGSPPRSTKRGRSSSPTMAMDAKAVDDYATMFPDAMKIGVA